MHSYSTLKSWVFNANLTSNADIRLFCLPYAGGGASLYRDWGKMLESKGIDVCPIQLPGRENRGLEAPLTDLRQVVHKLAAVLQPLLNKPFALFGHSMGALISYELAQEIIKLYGTVPLHLFVSGSSAPQLRSTDKPLHHLPDPELIEELRNLNGTPDELLQNAELMQILLPRLRADFSICETYRYMPVDQLDCPVSVFGGTRDSGVSDSKLEGWRELTGGDFTLRKFEGDHFFIHAEYQSMIKCIFNDLNTSTARINRMSRVSVY